MNEEFLKEVKKIREALEYQNELIETLITEKGRSNSEDMMKKMEEILSKTLGNEMGGAIIKEMLKAKKGFPK